MIRNKMIFDTFMVDESNRFAHAILQHVAKCLKEHGNKEESFNPIVIYGPSGCGKTHLLNAVYTVAEGCKTLFVPANEWADDLICGYNKKDMTDFNNKYSDLELLIIDDLDNLRGKDVTQEEFARFVYQKIKSSCFVIISSTLKFSEYPVLSSEFYRCFEKANAIVADITNPDACFRKKIIYELSTEMGIRIEADAIAYISRYKLTYGQIRGIMNKLEFYIAQSGRPVTLELLKKIMISYAYGGPEDEN